MKEFMDKIFHQSDLPIELLASWRKQGKQLVFTNGCFDLLHRGHIHYLAEANALGDKLIIGLNSDRSVKKIKGDKRPVKNEQNRAEILAALSFVDLIVIFEEETPLELITKVIPDTLVKGGDWSVDQIVGHERVIQNGGQVISLPFLEGESTSIIIEKIIKSHT